MPRGSFMQFDETTSDLSDNAYRVLGYLRHHVIKSNEVYPSIESMSEDLKRSIRTCKYAISELKAAGLIDVERDPKGRWVYRIHGAKICTVTVQKSAPVSATHSATHSAKNCTPPNNPLICKATEATETTEGSSGGSSQESKPTEKATTTTTTQNLEPFESESTATLPVVRNAVERFRTRTIELRPTEFKPETRARMLEVLGTDCEQFARKVTQEQADAGFPDWIMGEAARNKTPGRLAFHLLKTAWQEGWIDPQAAEDARLEEMADMIRSLK